MKLKFNSVLISLVTLLVLTEVGLRAIGIIDFPLYDANSTIGYIPKPSQSGSFLNTNDWQFNSLSMGSGEFKPSDAIDTLLIGDSIVLGGNPYRQQDRLAPQLEAETKLPVWPISAGSWGLRNELIYLKLHPDVVKSVDKLIFILNSEDFDKASSWSCEITHPRSYPYLAIIYTIQKYVYNWQSCTPLTRFIGA